MREIKFRAWLKETKEMLQFEPMEITTPTIYSKEYPDNYFWEKGKRNFRLEADREGCDDYNHDDLNQPPEEKWVMMQYTGLKDKNGTEIYEGDIVETACDKNMQVSIGGYWGTVGDIGFGVHIHNQDETRVFGVSPFNQDNNLEVIGNIYENPELL